MDEEESTPPFSEDTRYQCLLFGCFCCCCRAPVHGTGLHKDIFIEVYNALSGALPLPSSSFPIPLAHFTVHVHFHVICTYVILCVYSKHRTHKRRDLTVSLKTLSAPHIYVMNFSCFYPHFPLISLCVYFMIIYS